jgi:hypothetical protein
MTRPRRSRTRPDDREAGRGPCGSCAPCSSGAILKERAHEGSGGRHWPNFQDTFPRRARAFPMFRPRFQSAGAEAGAFGMQGGAFGARFQSTGTEAGAFGMQGGAFGMQGGASGTQTGASGTRLHGAGTPAGAFGTPTGTSGTSTGTSGTSTGASGTQIGASGTQTGASGTRLHGAGTPAGAFGTPAAAFGTPTGTSGTSTGASGTPTSASGRRRNLWERRPTLPDASRIFGNAARRFQTPPESLGGPPDASRRLPNLSGTRRRFRRPAQSSGRARPQAKLGPGVRVSPAAAPACLRPGRLHLGRVGRLGDVADDERAIGRDADGFQGTTSAPAPTSAG